MKESALNDEIRRKQFEAADNDDWDPVDKYQAEYDKIAEEPRSITAKCLRERIKI